MGKRRKSTRSALNVRRDPTVDTYGDVLSNKCYFSRKSHFNRVWFEQCNDWKVWFNRLPNSQNASIMSGGGFMRGTKFRYTGRTEREILTESLNALRQQHLLNNTSPSKRKANSVPATPSSPQGDLADIRKWNT